MSAILRKWLASKLGIIIDYDLASFEDIAQDGTLLAGILYNYGVITFKNLNQIVKTYDINVIQSNLAQLRVWLTLIGVDLSEKEIYGIVYKEKLVAVRLFYQLYVILNSKSKVDYFAQNIYNSTKTPTPPLGKLYNACKINEISVSPLAKEFKCLLRWQKNRYEVLMGNCNKVRTEYGKKLELKIKEVQEAKVKPVKKPITYDTLTTSHSKEKREICKKTLKNVAIKKPDLSIATNKGQCIENLPKAEKYINYLKHKYNKCYEVNKIHKQLNKMILLELMNNIVDKEDKEFKEIITSKLLKQSNYEKQMTLKLIDIRNQKYLMLQNLQQENKKIQAEKEQEFIEQLFQRDTNLTLKEQQFIDNRLRQFELHKKLWAKREKKEKKIRLDICRDIVHSFIDLAMKSSEYRKEYGHEVTPSVWDEWCVMFRAGLPIFDYVHDHSLIINDEVSIEEELTLELYRQNGLDTCDFNDYLEHYGIWHIESSQSNLIENAYPIEAAAKILGYIVHRLLLIKYPTPEQIPTPIFRQADIRAAVIGITNQEIVNLLQKTLTDKQILVVDLQTVVNYFIKAYLEESKIEDVAEIDKAAKKIKKQGKKEPKKNKKKKGSKKNEVVEEGIVMVPTGTQTPRIFPCCEITYTPIGELGKSAYETLNLGLQINEMLITQMLAEYLKNIDYIKGFVLINFPETINEAYFLEHFYNGKEIPSDYKTETSNDFADIETRDDIFTLPFDEFLEIRLSKLLPNPSPPEPETYESFFTSFTFMSLQKQSKSKIDLEMIETVPDFVKPLMDFYNKLLIANVLEFQTINFETIRDLVQLISKDVVFANKIFEELREHAMSKKKPAVKEHKEKKGKKGKNKSEKASKKSKKSSKDSKEEQKRSKVASQGKLDEEIVVEPPKPGEPLWEYINIPLPKELARLLATTWQDIELVYINDFKELFFMKRVAQNQIMPYVHDIEANMQNFIERPDDKQDFLHDFQQVFNDIQTDLREDEEYKAELHFRVQEFRNKLWTLCDQKMNECEVERKKIIEENWFTDHTMNIVNIYVKASQLELDRCVGTLQFLQDYYSSMVNRKPMDIKFNKQQLRKLDLSRSSEKLQFTHSLTNMFVDVPNKHDENKFADYLNSTLHHANGIVNQWKNNTNAALKAIETQFGEKKGPVKKEKKRTKKKAYLLTELDILISQCVGNLLLEWRSAIEGEILRTLMKLYLINKQATKHIVENIAQAEYLFHEIHNRIQDRYNEEVQSVDLVCQLFSRAIEACEPIQMRLVLDGAQFSIDDKKLFYPDEAFDYSAAKERVTDYEFTIAQLNMLVLILTDLAPSGVMSQKLFTFLLEDMLVVHAKDCYVSPLPHFWRFLKPDQVNEVIKELYNNDDYIDWKDFIIWNLLIPYPTEFDILDTRQQFRDMDPDKLEFVNEQQFSAVHFWFEDEYKDEQNILRMNMFKALLCRMFKCDSDKINYTALLLYFCKDEEALQGVIKAFELATGQLVCWDMSVGEKFIVVLKEKKAIQDELKRDAISAATSAVEKMYKQTVGECISTFSFLDVSEEAKEDEFVHKPPFILEDVGEEEEICHESVPSLCYFLTWSVLVKVMTAALPKETINSCINGKSLLEKLQDIYCSLRNPEFDNKVFIHEFLNNEEFTDIINSTSKFLALYPSDIVQSLIEVCTCEVKENADFL